MTRYVALMSEPGSWNPPRLLVLCRSEIAANGAYAGSETPSYGYGDGTQREGGS